MLVDGRRVLLCDCGGSMRLPGRPAHDLCRGEIGLLRAALGEGLPLLVACRQETAIFDEIRDEIAPDRPVAYLDIRDRAAWSDEGGAAGAKIAALLAEAAVTIPAVAAVTLDSMGEVLVLGRDEAAIAAARQLAKRQPVQVLLTGAEPVDMGSLDDVPVARGTIRAAHGHLGAFVVVADGHGAHLPGGRGAMRFAAPRDGVELRADILLDLTGGTPLFPDHWRRDGYLRPDPRDPAAVRTALFEATGLVGGFEKPRFVATRAELCAHRRNAITGCTRCLDVCPTGAAAPAGDSVAIDARVCAGCGSCAAACPTGALAYQLPTCDALLARLRALLVTYRERGGRDAVLLVHEEDGYEVLAAAARFGRGLPARVLPFAVNEITQLGFDHLAVALALGAQRIILLLPRRKRDEAAGLRLQLAMVEALSPGRALLLEEETPDGLSGLLYGLPPMPAPPAADFLVAGDRRGVRAMALSHLAGPGAAPVAMPAGSPFGEVVLDAPKCTLCMACTQACPTGALRADPERPRLSFHEQACVQCGLCRATCPEAAVTLVPRLSFAPQGARVLKEGEPARCVRCGKDFGILGVIERMATALADRHPMFMGEAAKRLRMCEDCRVVVQFETGDNPMAGAAPPRPRTTGDDLREREERTMS